jgi:hypothetical protein
MNTIKVELPDGRLIKLEGSNAQETARFLRNYLGLTGAEDDDGFGNELVDNDDEEPMPMPVMTFGEPPQTESRGSFLVHQSDNDDDEEPMLMPTMNFERKGR